MKQLKSITEKATQNVNTLSNEDIVLVTPIVSYIEKLEENFSITVKESTVSLTTETGLSLYFAMPMAKQDFYIRYLLNKLKDISNCEGFFFTIFDTNLLLEEPPAESVQLYSAKKLPEELQYLPVLLKIHKKEVLNFKITSDTVIFKKGEQVIYRYPVLGEPFKTFVFISIYLINIEYTTSIEYDVVEEPNNQ